MGPCAGRCSNQKVTISHGMASVSWGHEPLRPDGKAQVPLPLHRVMIITHVLSSLPCRRGMTPFTAATPRVPLPSPRPDPLKVTVNTALRPWYTIFFVRPRVFRLRAVIRQLLGHAQSVYNASLFPTLLTPASPLTTVSLILRS